MPGTANKTKNLPKKGTKSSNQKPSASAPKKGKAMPKVRMIGATKVYRPNPKPHPMDKFRQWVPSPNGVFLNGSALSRRGSLYHRNFTGYKTITFSALNFSDWTGVSEVQALTLDDAINPDKASANNLFDQYRINYVSVIITNVNHTAGWSPGGGGNENLRLKAPDSACRVFYVRNLDYDSPNPSVGHAGLEEFLNMQGAISFNAHQLVNNAIEADPGFCPVGYENSTDAGREIKRWLDLNNSNIPHLGFNFAVRDLDQRFIAGDVITLDYLFEMNVSFRGTQ